MPPTWTATPNIWSASISIMIMAVILNFILQFVDEHTQNRCAFYRAELAKKQKEAELAKMKNEAAELAKMHEAPPPQRAKSAPALRESITRP
jgi:uncharacterized membrane protein (DUF106 family)